MSCQNLNDIASSILDRAVANGEAAGAGLLVLKNGHEAVYAQSGYSDIENKRKMDRDTIVRLYSMSKPVTSAAMMILFDRGLVDLTEPVDKFLPGFSNQVYIKDGKPVPVLRKTILKDLMCMTSGLPYARPSIAGNAAETSFNEVISRLNSDNPVTTYEFANMLGQNPLEFSPGTHFMYGTSADIIGAVIEVITKKRFGDFLKEEIFEPLDMKDTGFYVPEEKQNRLSKVYQILPDGKLGLYTYENLGISSDMKNPPAYEAGGAGLVSTLDDYSHFAKMLLNNGSYGNHTILSPAAVRYMTTGELQPWQQEDLARGWNGLEGYSYCNLLRVMKNPSLSLMQTTLGEYGWDGWLGAYFSNHPGINVTFLLTMQLTNAGTTPMLRKLRNALLPYLQ